MKHPHAEIIKALADDDSLSLWRKHHSEQWYGIYHGKIECVVSSPGGQFHLGPTPPPRMIETPFGSYPEPLMEAPEQGTTYWIPRMDGEAICCHGWHGLNNYEKHWLKTGMIHLTQDAAYAHAQVELKRRMAELGWEKS